MQHQFEKGDFIVHFAGKKNTQEQKTRKYNMLSEFLSTAELTFASYHPGN
jgi:hypothetical protein